MSAAALSPSTGPAHPTGPIIKAAEAESWIDGFAYRDRARREVERLLADTLGAYERRKTEGYEEGRREGAAASAELLAETAARVDRYLAGIESELVELALGVVRRVAGDLEPRDLVVRLAREAIEGFRREQALIVTVAPENLDVARRELRTEHDGGRRVSVEADARLGPLDCRVESPYSIVDAGLEAQLGVMREELSAKAGAA